ncbi:hypothetical protein DKX38_008923 [Salix brachista]|uniref:Uncharacterized protein n=1 Tax=Salix brachista TaxID=2182728 RepID=A0A5N5M9R7_9ROSI|nr:hypothetical protein DKX38_008923 [Salix brachista]
MQLARKQFKVRMDSLSFSLEGCGSTETLEEDKGLSLAQLEEIDTIKALAEMKILINTGKEERLPSCLMYNIGKGNQGVVPQMIHLNGWTGSDTLMFRSFV